MASLFKLLKIASPFSYDLIIIYMCKQSQINRDKIIKIFYLYFKINLQIKNILKRPKVRYLRMKKELKKNIKILKKSPF